MKTTSEISREIVEDCVEGDTDTSYGFALNCGAEYLEAKITTALDAERLRAEKFKEALEEVGNVVAQLILREAGE